MQNSKYPPISTSNDLEMVQQGLRPQKFFLDINCFQKSKEDRIRLKQIKRVKNDTYDKLTSMDFFNQIMGCNNLRFNLGKLGKL